MSNHETKNKSESLHLFLAFERNKFSNKNRCFRTIIKDNEEESLNIFESKLKIIGGNWRIHKTVNARCVNKARAWLLHRLIDHPEQAAWTDSLWRTALLQKESALEKKFMFDVDSQDRKIINEIHHTISKSGGYVIESHMSPSGIHVITKPFDSREVVKIDNVSLLRDGYFFIKSVGEKK